MKFDLSAAKAYVGGTITAIASGGELALPVAHWLDGLAGALLGFAPPDTLDTVVSYGLAYVVGHVAVYFMPNKAVE